MTTRTRGPLTSGELGQMVVAYYWLPGNDDGGSLHIVLEDGNYEDRNVRYCLRWAQEHGDVFGARLALALLAHSRTQRSRATKDAHEIMRATDAEIRDRRTPEAAAGRPVCWHL